MIGFWAEEIEQALGGKPVYQQLCLLVRACPAQRVQQHGDGERVVEGAEGARAAGSRASKTATCSSAPALRSAPSSRATASGSPRAAWAAGSRASNAAACSSAPALRSASSSLATARRVVEGGVGGGAISQRGCLVLGARFAQRVQQLGDSERVAEGDVGRGIAGEQNGYLVVRAHSAQRLQQPATATGR